MKTICKKVQKQTLLGLAILAASVAMVSCSVDDPIADNSMAVKFTSGITATPQVRSTIDGTGNSLWDLNDPIGIYMVNNGTTTVAEGAENIRYTAVQAGATTTFNPGGTAIYYPVNETNKVSFIAYHPHNAAVANYVYPVNLATQSSQTGIDLMYAAANNGGAGYDKAYNAAINFTFGHKLAKLVMNISKVGLTDNITAVSITGMNTKANFDLTGVDGLTGEGTPQAITPATITAETKYEAILLPATLGTGHTVEFTAGGNTYVWKMSEDIAKLEAGRIYTYDVTITRYAVNVSGSITKWEVGSAGNGTAE